MMMNPWYAIENISDVPSPQLVIYQERVCYNIEQAIAMVGDSGRLRPHIKTNKSAEVVRLMLSAGIRQFKFATVEEGELLGEENAPDALMAYQPVGPRVQQLADLIIRYPHTRFSCLLDHADAATALSEAFTRLSLQVDVYIDLNVGMNRTGIAVDTAFSFYSLCSTLPALRVMGLHAYDGHIRDVDFALRKQRCDEAFAKVDALAGQIEKSGMGKPIIIMGGSPSFSVHATRREVQCSPGTFVYWDKGYHDICAEQPFVPAALVVTRVISLPAAGRACVDMGHKAIAAENDIARRAFFLDAPEVKLISQSEEHGVIELQEGYSVKPGDVFYVLPHHVCPTVNMYNKAYIVMDGKAMDAWTVDAKH